MCIRDSRIADHAHAHIVFVCCLNAVLQIAFQKLHQRFHFALRAVPVFRRKCVHGNILYTEIMCRLAYRLDISGSRCVSVIPGHSLCLCPSSVSKMCIRDSFMNSGRISSILGASSTMSSLMDVSCSIDVYKRQPLSRRIHRYCPVQADF